MTRFQPLTDPHFPPKHRINLSSHLLCKPHTISACFLSLYKISFWISPRPSRNAFVVPLICQKSRKTLYPKVRCIFMEYRNSVPIFLDLTRILCVILDPATASSSPQSNPVYRSRVRTEPTNATAPQFAAALWSRLEIMIEEMADCCVKVRALNIFFIMSCAGETSRQACARRLGAWIVRLSEWALRFYSPTHENVCATSA